MTCARSLLLLRCSNDDAYYFIRPAGRWLVTDVTHWQDKRPHLTLANWPEIKHRTVLVPGVVPCFKLCMGVRLIGLALHFKIILVDQISGSKPQDFKHLLDAFRFDFSVGQ